MNADDRRKKALYFSGMYILGVYDNMETFAWELCLVEAHTEAQDTGANWTFHVTFSCPVTTTLKNKTPSIIITWAVSLENFLYEMWVKEWKTTTLWKKTVKTSLKTKIFLGSWCTKL